MHVGFITLNLMYRDGTTYTMKSIVRTVIFIIIVLICAENVKAQLRIQGTIYSESIVRATVKAPGITDWREVYFAPPKRMKNDGLIYYRTKYEIPWQLEKGIDHAIRFTDGLVEKMIFVSGVIPEGIYPKQKFTIDIDLVESDEADMTLIVFWSIPSSSFKALPLSQLKIIKNEAHPDFKWTDGSESPTSAYEGLQGGVDY